MTEPEQAQEQAVLEEDLDKGSEQLRALLKRALSEDAVAKETPDLLRAVQRRIRKRSRGKFFGDGWSTSQARLGYVMVALITLLLVVVAYYGLGPMALR
jgi:hypothetical protein